ncbi:hypothetical protein IX317_001950 [Fusobacterium sp. DD29]|uniref:DUF6981 domain-containing protein n=1 Tax=unclassified Fusobacterium TaxID=2648384 RepID=UPI001B8AB743|nr:MULTISPECIES: hypothetical protein [unclassified Fusobacterium]MBR8700467.1 hypothetical protein [Fusobacterium sp. DD45]MBR8710216.1 hypothetical protein [Fusobacterium sp. DD28]MBR8750253.1 hypothetical protein [Fusobacterium sp. DD29]MBR8750683.1 hypothetical protein [Fusobacterium sp. DD26]MBR8762494.1 hypothetical protein [Fusobacterium sp. DD25]
MKKYLAILSVLTLLLASCNNETKEAKNEAAPQQVEQTTEAGASQNEKEEVEQTQEQVQEETGEVGETGENEDEAYVEESEYASFEKSMLDLYSGEGITNIMVAPYAKGVDIIFNVDNKNMTKEEFNNIAKEVVKELKNNFDYIDKDLKIGCSLEYQPDPNENAEVLMTADVK